jgi:uncharacterized membrane protein
MRGCSQRIRGYWRRHFLGCEFVLGIGITLTFAGWMQWANGLPSVNNLLSGQRGAIYGTVTSLDGALLGFIIATATIVLSFAPNDRFAVLRNSVHYKTLWRTFTSTIRFLGLATLLALVALLGDRDTAPNRALMLLCAGSTLLAVLRIARSAWILEKTIKVVTAPSDDDRSES